MINFNGIPIIYPLWFLIFIIQIVVFIPSFIFKTKESSGCQFYIVHGKVYKEEELTLDINALYGGVRRLLQEEEYSDMRQKFIDAQNDPEETQKLAISLSEICEEKYGMQIRKTISDEILKAYTTVGGVPHLDGAYTVFGRIVEGLEVIDKIASVKTGAADKPVEDIPMTFKIKKISKEKITRDYGYSYPQ